MMMMIRVVETSVLARAEPPDVTYQLHPKMDPLIKSGVLSNLQLESIIYASQTHENIIVNGGQVGGFFLGESSLVK
jgi:hypothetical protein